MLEVWNEYKWIIVGMVLLLCLGAGFGSGYKVRGWHDDSAALKQTQSELTDLHNGFNKVVASSDAATDALNKLNQQTEASQSVLTKRLGDQSEAFMHIQLGLKGANVGGCTLTPDADGLYLRAYQAAFGSSSPKAGAKGKAGAGHAATQVTHDASPGHATSGR